jgi:ribosome-associated toxin RatA of RatAB toxin-antitoxin module
LYVSQLSMPVSKRTLPVACRLDDAFEHVADWTNLKNFMPMLQDLKPTSLVSYGPGTSLQATVVLAKLEISTTFDLVEFVKNKRILYKATRGIKSKLSWDFIPDGDKVVITYTYEYEIPPGLALKGSDMEAIQKDMQERTDQGMELLKWVLESGAATHRDE